MRCKKFLIFFLAVLFIPGTSFGITAQPVHATVVSRSHCRNLYLTATSAILMDARTGAVLYGKNASKLMAPASTTKIMTAVLALEKGGLEKPVSVSTLASSQEGSSMNLAPTQSLSLQNLLYGLLLVSGNDAATAIAESIGGSEKDFALLMTEKAHLLGMQNTQFKNASGLPAPGHYTTAYDLALLTQYALKNPVFAKIVQTKEIALTDPLSRSSRTLINHNKLLWRYPYTTGVKTGYTAEAGGCLVASAQYQGRTLVAVVLKSRAIYSDCTKLFSYGFHQ